MEAKKSAKTYIFHSGYRTGRKARKNPDEESLVVNLKTIFYYAPIRRIIVGRYDRFRVQIYMRACANILRKKRRQNAIVALCNGEKFCGKLPVRKTLRRRIEIVSKKSYIKCK